MNELILHNKNKSIMEVIGTFFKSLFLVTFVYTFDYMYIGVATVLSFDFPEFSTYLVEIKDIVSCLTAIGAFILIIFKIRNEIKKPKKQ